MEKAVIIFSIDDGRADMYELVKEILLPQNIPATFNITTTGGFRREMPLISTENLQEVAQNPLFEFANHSDMHTNEFDDIRKGYLTLCERLGYDNTKPIGFASPGSRMTIEFIKENIDEMKKLGVKYVRTCYPDYFNRDEDTIALTSYPVIFTTSLEELKNLADTAAENKYCLIYLFHSVLKKGAEDYGNPWSYDFDDFKELIGYVKELQCQGKIDIMTTMDYVDMQLNN